MSFPECMPRAAFQICFKNDVLSKFLKVIQVITFPGTIFTGRNTHSFIVLVESSTQVGGIANILLILIWERF